MPNELTPQQLFEEKIKARLRAEIGDLIPDDVLKDLLGKAIQEMFFTRRESRPDNWHGKHIFPSWFEETVGQLLRDRLDNEEIARIARAAAEEIEEALDGDADIQDVERIILRHIAPLVDKIVPLTHEELLKWARDLDLPLNNFGDQLEADFAQAVRMLINCQAQLAACREALERIRSICSIENYPVPGAGDVRIPVILKIAALAATSDPQADLRSTVERASERVSEWPEWKRAITVARDNTQADLRRENGELATRELLAKRAAEAERDSLRAELESWKSYFGCDNPHDTHVMDGGPLGKEQARANKLEAELAKRRAAFDAARKEKP
jgi:hypothetical protein